MKAFDAEQLGQRAGPQPIWSPSSSRSTGRVGYRCAIAAVLWLIGLAAAHADGVRLLADDREAIQARIDLIQQAEHDIVLAHYAVNRGYVPTSLLAVLQEAAGRGVRVRIIVDGLVSRFPVQMYRFLEEQGVEVRSYHPLRAAHPLWLNRRIHVKLLVVDGQQMIVGSRNLQDEHFGLGDETYADCDAYLCGSSAAHARRYFDWLWQTEDVQPIRRIDSPTYGILGVRPLGHDPRTSAWRNAREPADFQRLLSTSLAALVRCHAIRLHTGSDWSADLSHELPAAILHDSGTSKHHHTVETSILRLINQALGRVLIVTPYPVLTRPTMKAIAAAHRRGVQVTLVTNSLQSTDRIAVYSAYQNLKRELVDAGVELWEYPGPRTLHTKAMVIDGCIAMIGSYNFDPRSAYSNLELVAVVRSRRAAANLERAVWHQLAGAQRVNSARHRLALPGWLTGASDDAGARASAARQVKMQLHRLLVPTYRWLL